MPTFRHEEQPGADLRSRRTREKQDEPGIVACIYNLQSSYEACEKTILASRRLAKGEGGRDLLSIIGRRISWLQDDVISNRRKFDDRSVDLLNCGTQREQGNRIRGLIPSTYRGTNAVLQSTSLSRKRFDR